MSPFEQGYEAALRATLPTAVRGAPLSDEALAAVIRDCATLGGKRMYAGGVACWMARQKGFLRGVDLPPQRPIVRDGRVHLRESQP